MYTDVFTVLLLMVRRDCGFWNDPESCESGYNIYNVQDHIEQQFSHLHIIYHRPFFIQPIFRDNGYFMLISQYQSPSHFLLAFLEDFKMDPNRAQALLTFSIFNEFVEEHDISLVRCDIINRGIEDHEGRKVVENMLDAYRLEDEYSRVLLFNNEPTRFDFDEFISHTKIKWKGDAQTDIEVK